MKYKKKPVEIEAWQFTKKNFSKSVPHWIRDKFARDKLTKETPITLWSQYAGEVIEGEIFTLEGIHKVNENDWIIKGVKGEFYPCKPDIFKMTYEKVGE